MSKLWTFGDSFTEGHGCHPGHPYYDNYPEERRQIWVEELAHKLDLKLENLGYGGNSNPFILSQILNNLSNFSKEDIIIVQQTIPERGVIGNLNTEKMTWVPSEAVGQNNREDWIMSTFSSSVAYEAYRNYILDILLPQNYIFNDWYEKQFRGLCKFLVDSNFKVFFWSFNDWGKFENIHDRTDGTVADLHWSWEGHKAFTAFMYKRIKKNLFIPKGRKL